MMHRLMVAVLFFGSCLGLSEVSSEDIDIRLEGRMFTPSPPSMPVYSELVVRVLSEQSAV